MEIVVTVALVGIAGTAPIVAMQVAARGAAIHQEMAVEQAALSSAADLLSSDIVSWSSCTSSEDALVERYQDEIDTRIGLDVVARVAGVDFWDGTDYGPTCAMSQGHRLQRIMLEVVNDSGVASIHVVKRPPHDEVPTAGTVAVPGAVAFENTIDHQATTTVPAPSTPPAVTTTTAPTTSPTTTTPTSPATTTPATTTSTTTSTTSTTSTTTPQGPVTCTAIVGRWNQQVDVEIRNGATMRTNGWTVVVTYPSPPVVNNTWNVEWRLEGDSFVASSLGWNQHIQPGDDFTFGVQTAADSPKLTSDQSLPCIVRGSG